MTEQLTLFNLAPTQTIQTVHDPYWDEIVLSPGTVEENGQISLLYDDSTEPPDPDDYATRQDYERAWDEWVQKFPELVAFTQVMSVREQVTPATISPPVEPLVGGQVTTVTNKLAHQHDDHWVEKYWVERSGNKYWYYRYTWREGSKKHRIYLGSVHSLKAREKKLTVQNAIADGQTPIEIKQLIRGNND